MSVTFHVMNLELDIEDQMDYNFANGNAVDLLANLNI